MLYLFTLAAGFVVPIVLMVAMVWSATKRWTYRLLAVPVIVVVWAGAMVLMVEAENDRMHECMDTWAYQYGGRSCR